MTECGGMSFMAERVVYANLRNEERKFARGITGAARLAGNFK